MNKMIKRQDIVPPWIEKQQELLKAANVFRARLRNDWKRHAARMIASRGGSLQEQMARAEEYARAEDVHNPRRRHVDQISVPTNATDDVVMERIRHPSQPVDSSSPQANPASAEPNPTTPSQEPQTTTTRPFRDPTWEATERSYMELAISNLNSITRSYNLMAPELAKKPYFSLERELSNCFADIAPLLANEIKDRAVKGPTKTLSYTASHRARGMLEVFGADGKGSVKIHESKAPHYGLRQFWRDLWGAPKG